MKAAEDMSTPVGTRVRHSVTGHEGRITGRYYGRYTATWDDGTAGRHFPQNLAIIEEPAPAERMYTLELTEQEAKVLRVIVGHVVGDFYNSPRRETSAIFDKFQKMGFWDEDKMITGLASPATNGSLVYFRNYPEPEPEFVGHEIEDCRRCKHSRTKLDAKPCDMCWHIRTANKLSYFTPKEATK